LKPKYNAHGTKEERELSNKTKVDGAAITNGEGKGPGGPAKHRFRFRKKNRSGKRG